MIFGVGISIYGFFVNPEPLSPLSWSCILRYLHPDEVFEFSKQKSVADDPSGFQ